jgi:hypothetical protein
MTIWKEITREGIEETLKLFDEIYKENLPYNKLLYWPCRIQLKNIFNPEHHYEYRCLCHKESREIIIFPDEIFWGIKHPWLSSSSFLQHQTKREPFGIIFDDDPITNYQVCPQCGIHLLLMDGAKKICAGQLLRGFSICTPILD